MIVIRFLLRFILVPLGACFAAMVAAVVATFAHWSKFTATIANDPTAPDNLVLAILYLAPAVAVIMAVGSFAMLMPAAIGIAISEAFAIRSWIYHVANGALASWVGWLTMTEILKQYEFYDNPTITVGSGIAAGFAYWIVAGWSAGFWKPVFAPPPSSPPSIAPA
jgi:hypothetical protein